MALRTVSLPRGARANVTLTIGATVELTAPPEFALAPLDGYPAGDAWTAGAWDTADVVVAGEHRRDLKVLLEGPLAPTPSSGVPVAADSLLYARVVDAPEVLPAEPVRVSLAP